TTPAAREVLEKVAFSTEQLVKLVAGLLDLSRIESGKIKYEMTEGDLAKVAGEVIDKFKQNAEKKGVAIVFENKAGAVPFAFDHDKVREAVVNYLDNAVKYSEAGNIVVGLERVGAGAGAMMRLSVKDTGIGIKLGDVEKLFAKFSRTEEAKRYDPAGMGIGLFFVKRIIADHGGSVGAVSEGIGKGSTFWFELPVTSRF
ncbi:MAG: HAMP domain-containing histidine kinase, partial [Candidatus Sungbacteria bacterium]|nr:HAMP domain-containing histidine kinase [Candidatus Sungbacteria bacterium]